MQYQMSFQNGRADSIPDHSQKPSAYESGQPETHSHNLQEQEANYANHEDADDGILFVRPNSR
jgi:hypothetical protein